MTSHPWLPALLMFAGCTSGLRYDPALQSKYEHINARAYDGRLRATAAWGFPTTPMAHAESVREPNGRYLIVVSPLPFPLGAGWPPCWTLRVLAHEVAHVARGGRTGWYGDPHDAAWVRERDRVAETMGWHVP